MPQEHIAKDIKEKIFEITHALYRVTNLFPKSESLFYDLRKEASEILKECARYSVIPENTFDEIMNIIGKIRGMRSLLWLARSNYFVTSINMEVLEREYHKLESFFSGKIDLLRITDKTNKISAKNPLPVEKHNVPLKKLKEKTMLKEAHAEIQNVLLKDNGEVVQEQFQRQKDIISIKDVNDIPALLKENENDLKTIDDRKKTIIDILNQKDKTSIKDIVGFFKEVSSKTIQRDLNTLIHLNVVERFGDRRWAIYSLKK